MKLPSFLIPKSVRDTIDMAKSASSMVSETSSAMKEHGAAKKAAAANPPRPGTEHLFCYGNIAFDGLPWATLVMARPMEEVRGLLAQAWNVTNHEQAVATLAWLRDSGHRSEYQRWVAPALSYTPPKYSAVLTAAYTGGKKGDVEGPSEELASYGEGLGEMLQSLQTYRKRVSGKTLTVEQFNATTIMDAWDIERIGNVVRLSVYAGYISEDEAYQWLAVADQMAKQRFTAWSQYAASFLVGRALSYSDSIEGVERFADNTGSALNRADSPWRTYSL